MQFNVILIDVAMKNSLDAEGLGVKLYYDLGGIGISHEYAI